MIAINLSVKIGIYPCSSV